VIAPVGSPEGAASEAGALVAQAVDPAGEALHREVCQEAVRLAVPVRVPFVPLTNHRSKTMRHGLGPILLLGHFVPEIHIPAQHAHRLLRLLDDPRHLRYD
jgi:hypothetical protein